MGYKPAVLFKNTLRGHSKSVNSVVVALDGKRIISGGSDNLIKAWDMVTGREILNLEGHHGAVTVWLFLPMVTPFVGRQGPWLAIIWAGPYQKGFQRHSGLNLRRNYLVRDWLFLGQAF